MTRHKTCPSYQRGIDAALALLKAIGRKDGPSRVSDVALALHIPHASVYRIIRTLAEHSLVVSTGRGWIAPGPTWATLARRYEDAVRAKTNGRECGSCSILGPWRRLHLPGRSASIPARIRPQLPQVPEVSDRLRERCARQSLAHRARARG